MIWDAVLNERRRVRVGATVRHKPTGRKGYVLRHVEVTRETPCHAGVEWPDGSYEHVATRLLHEIAPASSLTSPSAAGKVAVSSRSQEDS